MSQKFLTRLNPFRKKSLTHSARPKDAEVERIKAALATNLTKFEETTQFCVDSICRNGVIKA